MTDDIYSLRDKIIAKKTMQEKALEESSVALKNINELLLKLTPERKELLQRYGCDIEFLDTLNIEKLSSDPSYLESVKTSVDHIVEQVYNTLKTILE